MSTLDRRTLRNAFGRYMTGVTVVTCLSADGTPVGFTANSFTSVSLDPPLLLVCPGKFLSSFEAFSTCQHFGVSVLAEGQEEVANVFAGYKGDRFARVPHRLDPAGVPLIDGAIARFSCKTDRIIPAGDHCVLFGEVTGFDEADKGGLGYAGGRFFSLGLERQARDPAARSNICGAVVEVDGAVLFERTPQGYRLPECAVPDHAALRRQIRRTLESQGVKAELGPVYSVFDDAGSGTHHAYLLARASDVSSNSPLVAVPVSDLGSLTYATPALAHMMQRFAAEARTRDFSLYLGDASVGATHQLHERA